MTLMGLIVKCKLEKFGERMKSKVQVLSQLLIVLKKEDCASRDVPFDKV